MPTYEYACTNCGHHVEVFQRFSEAPLTTCGVCGGALRKVFHPAGIVFKGSGFYATDSRSKGTAASGSGSSDGGSSSSGGATPAKAEPAKDGSAKDGSAKDGSAKDGSGSTAKEAAG